MKATVENKTFEVECDHIDVTPSREEDPNWSKECNCGIVHTYHCVDEGWESEPALHDVETPTLKYVIDFEGTYELPSQGHYECKECGEEVTPKMRTPWQRYHIPRAKTYYINDRQVSKERFEREFNAR